MPLSRLSMKLRSEVFQAKIEPRARDITALLIRLKAVLDAVRLAEAGEVERIVSELEGTSYHLALSLALGKYREKALEEHYPVLKNFEVQNLIAIFRLTGKGFTGGEIRQLLRGLADSYIAFNKG